MASKFPDNCWVLTEAISLHNWDISETLQAQQKVEDLDASIPNRNAGGKTPAFRLLSQSHVKLCINNWMQALINKLIIIFVATYFV